MTEEVVVSITSQDVLSLRQSCQVIIQAYKQYCGKILASDENAIYPMMLEQIIGLKGDATAGIDTLDSYSNLDMNNIDRPKTDVTTMSSFNDVNNVTGNFEITQSLYDDAADTAKEMFAGLKDREVETVESAIGSDFTEEENRENISPSTSTPTPERINEGGARSLPANTARTEETAPVSNDVSYQNNKKGKYRNVISEDCIPCALRLGSLDDINVGLELLNPLTEMVNRYNKLADQMGNLFTNTAIQDDLCSLLDFLGAQCIPDLFAIIALLNAMMLKDIGLTLNLDGAFMMFIGPFFSPLLSGLSGVLDQYMQAIMQPIDCVINALDTQLAKLDVGKAIDQAEVREVAEQRRREGYLRRKREELKSRADFLKEARLEYGGNSVPPRKLGGVRLGDEIDITQSMNASNPGYITIDQELEKIESDLGVLDSDYEKNYGPNGEYNIEKMIKKSQDPYESSSRKLANLAGDGRDVLKDASLALSSGLQELRVKVLNGKKMVNGTLKSISEELGRLIKGRASTSEEMTAGLLEIQKTIRLIALIKTLIQLAEKGNMCKNEGGDPSVVLGSYLTASRGETESAGHHGIYEGEDSEGDKYLIVAPPESTLSLVDSSGTRQMDEIGEVNKLNSQGIVKNIGNISNKKIVASVPDLGVEVPIQAVKINLCKRINRSTESTIAGIEHWATNAGL